MLSDTVGNFLCLQSIFPQRLAITKRNGCLESIYRIKLPLLYAFEAVIKKILLLNRMDDMISAAFEEHLHH